jgi:hypothetical protein
VKKVEHPIVNALEAYPKLINAIAQIIGLRPAQFVSDLFEALNLQSALILSPGWESIKPLQQWYRRIGFPVEDDLCPWRCFSFIVLNFENKVKLFLHVFLIE